MEICSKLIYELLGTNVSEDVKLDKVLNKHLIKTFAKECNLITLGGYPQCGKPPSTLLNKVGNPIAITPVNHYPF